MDVLTLALLLFLLDGRTDLKQTTEKFLAFYRENGPLLKALASSLREGGEKTDPIPTKSPPEEKTEQKKDRPEEETVLTKVLEDYLKRRT